METSLKRKVLLESWRYQSAVAWVDLSPVTRISKFHELISTTTIPAAVVLV